MDTNRKPRSQGMGDQGHRSGKSPAGPGLRPCLLSVSSRARLVPTPCEAGLYTNVALLLPWGPENSGGVLVGKYLLPLGHVWVFQEGQNPGWTHAGARGHSKGPSDMNNPRARASRVSREARKKTGTWLPPGPAPLSLDRRWSCEKCVSLLQDTGMQGERGTMVGTEKERPRPPITSQFLRAHGEPPG